MNIPINQTLSAAAWPFREAEAILKRINYKLPAKGYVLFETGYGPSGLPHIGTFGEVIRTKMVQNAFEQISDMPTRLLCVSDDMDGMRKIPDTIPNQDDYIQYLGLPLTSIPDPFGTHQSFGHNMNARLQTFLDAFGFEYSFLSSTDCYKRGVYNDSLLNVLRHYDEIMAVMLPTLREERQATYSPFLPLCPDTGRVLQVPIIAHDVESGSISYKNLDGIVITVPVTNGHCKLQWKPDFGMRWAAFDVDFEMYGKDHLVNGQIYTKICNIIGGKAPHQMFYELFLDEVGQKISKSKGNGVSMETWLRYAPQESLSFFMYQSPQKAKRLSIDMIPKNVDEYLTFLYKYHEEVDKNKKLANPAYHIHKGKPPVLMTSLSYSLLLNLVAACNTSDKNVIWQYLKIFDPSISSHSDLSRSSADSNGTNPFIDILVECAINYYNDFVKPHQKFRAPTAREVQALEHLREALNTSNFQTSQELQNLLYSIAKEFEFEMRTWFQALYEILLGASSGPRFGSFIALYGIKETVQLINDKVKSNELGKQA